LDTIDNRRWFDAPNFTLRGRQQRLQVAGGPKGKLHRRVAGLQWYKSVGHDFVPEFGPWI